jgi:putative hydrolase of the HAD superfamily
MLTIIFDLDDTLYDERLYVESGLRAVAKFGKKEFGWNEGQSFRFMVEVLDREGRGAVFDSWLLSNDAWSKSLVRQCIREYRHHQPKLTLSPEVKALLSSLKKHPLYLVTDGHKIVQGNKVKALALEKYFKHIYITHRYGIAKAKPSTYCFEQIKRREKCSWKEMVYIGDNPAKDFVNLNKKSMPTVRVLTGVHKSVKAKKGYDAKYRITDLGQLPNVLKRISKGTSA